MVTAGLTAADLVAPNLLGEVEVQWPLDIKNDAPQIEEPGIHSQPARVGVARMAATIWSATRSASLARAYSVATSSLCSIAS
jgi:hypothetical protein